MLCWGRVALVTCSWLRGPDVSCPGALRPSPWATEGRSVGVGLRRRVVVSLAMGGYSQCLVSCYQSYNNKYIHYIIFKHLSIIRKYIFEKKNDTLTFNQRPRLHLWSE